MASDNFSNDEIIGFSTKPGKKNSITVYNNFNVSDQLFTDPSDVDFSDLLPDWILFFIPGDIKKEMIDALPPIISQHTILNNKMGVSINSLFSDNFSMSLVVSNSKMFIQDGENILCSVPVIDFGLNMSNKKRFSFNRLSGKGKD